MKHIIIAAALALAVVPANAAGAIGVEDTVEPQETVQEAVEEAAQEDAAAEDADLWGVEAPQTINAYDGVYRFGDRVETYYSSNELYHYMTPEWILDDEGFYRTQEGYYVVAASDMGYGTVFEGSKGLCQVLDCGCACGVTDYYVNW